MDLRSIWMLMGETVYCRSCQYCGVGFDSTDQASAEAARDSHENSCSFK